MKQNLFIDKAYKLVDYAKIISIGSKMEIIQIFPQLKVTDQIDYWDLYCTVAATYSACLGSSIYIDNKNILNKVDRIVDKKLNDFDKLNGSGAFNDLDRYMNNFIVNNPDQKNTDESYLLSVGAWIIWNLTLKKPIDNEGRIASLLGNIFYKEFLHYYNI
ncbi:MAG: hypothetical protein M0P71_16615 [Melioribacteraceae bacterium]|nr:hypothetical protein [Melioribacteraceae bacterium]